MKSQITTKRGDSGNAVALDDKTYPKSHIIMECVGCTDEVRTQLALLRLQIIERRPAEYEILEDFLLWLLHVFFLIGAECSDPTMRRPENHRRRLCSRDLEELEDAQDYLERKTPLLNCFVVSGSNALSARADIVVTATRRLERKIVRLKEAVPEFEATDILAFVNRLSDYLYVLARTLDAGTQLGVDYEILGPQP